MTTVSTAAFVFFSVFTSTHGFHQLCQSVACFDTGDTQITATFDDDEILYIDFYNRCVVYNGKIPVADHIYPYGFALYVKHWCMLHLLTWKRDPSLQKSTEPLEVLLYPRDDVTEQINNTLVCFIRNFFPPTIKINWTKNREVLTTDDPFENIIPSSDGTFQYFSTLSFVPEYGDTYSCTVEHEALDEPIVRFFELNSIETDHRSYITLAVCLTFGTVAFAAGIFFFVQGNKYPG